jgi:hypothetical protein
MGWSVKLSNPRGTLAHARRDRQETRKYRPLVKRTYRVCARVMVIVTAIAAALVVVAALRLMAGPVNLDFLKDRIARAADVPGNDIRPDVEHISLEWGSLSQPMRLVFSGLRFINGENQVIATVPTAALTFDPRVVFQGMLLPNSVVIEKPVIEAEIDREGGMLRRIFSDPSSQSQGQAVAILVEQLLAKANYESLIGQLDTVKIEQAKVTLRDVKTGLAWVAPAVRAQLGRDEKGVIISANARFTGNGEPFDVTLAGVYTRDRSRISVEAMVDGIKPSMFADLSPDAALLRGVDIALSGRLLVEADGTGDVHSVVIDVKGGNGRVTLPGVLPAAHAVKSVSARATIDAASHTAEIERIALNFGAASVLVTGTGRRTPEGQTFAGRADIRRIPVDRLGDYWPLSFAEGGRRWALANLSNGEIDVGAEFALSAPGNDLAELKADKMIGLIDYRGMTVRYMPHMPELQGVLGKARYENGTLHFDVASGSAVNLKLGPTTIDLLKLEGAPPQNAAIRMAITGAAPDVIRFLARPKLGLPRDLLFDYRRLGGNVAIDLALGFPLIDALTVAEIDIKTEASLTHFSLNHVLGEVDLTDATAKVKYAGPELNVAGTGKLDGNAVEVSWRELFGTKAPFRRRYDLKGTIPANLIAKAGFPPLEPYVSGPLGTTLSYQVAHGAGEVVGRFDLKGATVAARPIGWNKEPGVEGQAQMTLKLGAGGKLTTIDFEGRANGLSGKGQARFTGDNALQQLSLQQFKVGRTDVAFDWKRLLNGVEVSVRGPSVELPRVRQGLKARDEMAAKDPAGAAGAARTRTRLNLQVQNMLTERGSLGYANGWLELSGERLASADLTIGAGKGSTLRVKPANGGRQLFLYVADFGLMLKDAGWLDGMSNGYLHIEGQYDDSTLDSPFSGLLKMGPFRLQKVAAPRWGIGTLNSTIEGLNRAGNALQQFDSLEANVAKSGDRLHIKNGRTSGQSIGLTAQGFVDLGNDTAKLGGIVVPAFALNNLLSNVPLLGQLLTGGRDGGVFAISYQLFGPLDDLKTDVNMMSAMTPGALRDLFTLQSDPNYSPPPSPEMQRAP